jgi:hypothetical protein
MRRSGIMGSMTLGAAAMLWGLPGCGSTAIALKESLGIPKRDQLVARVKDARDEQQEAKQQFASALEEFLAVTGASGGDLEAKYSKLKREYERSETRAEGVHGRIRDVERVAEALFKEWKAELSQYSNENLRRASQKELDSTRSRYEDLLAAMKAAESKMQPVLGAFKDQVLFLKHNLNARAIASLQGNVAQIQSDVGTLIKEMEASIDEANAFIDQMQKSDAK